MPDILLVQPPIRDFYLTAKRTIPYGLACIAAVLEGAGFSVEILDALATSRAKAVEPPPEMGYLQEYYGKPDVSPFCLFHTYRHYGYSYEHISARARESEAALVGIASLFTPYSGEALETAAAVKRGLPTCKIVLGGHHPTAMPGVVLQHTSVDWVVRGDGEVPMLLLAKALKSGSGLDDIPGLCGRRSSGSIDIKAPFWLKDIKEMPLPAAHLINHPFYRRGPKAGAVVVAGRGCPLQCSYCAMGRSSRPLCRRTVASVIAEIDDLVESHGVGFIDFEDEHLSMDRNWFMDLLKAITGRFDRAGLELRAMNGLYPPSLDDQIVAAMAGAGFKTMNLSLGSSVPRQTERFRRPDVRGAFDRVLVSAEKWGLGAVGYVIAGAPLQTAEDSIEDLLFLAQRRVLAGVSIYYPAPGSPDFHCCEKLGILPGCTGLMRSSALPISHATSRLEAATILRLGRILNYIKALLDRGERIPAGRPYSAPLMPPTGDRLQLGRALLRWFRHDAKIRGVTPEGEVYEHPVDRNLTRMFLRGLKRIPIRGTI